jgi:hypothetical protein
MKIEPFKYDTRFFLHASMYDERRRSRHTGEREVTIPGSHLNPSIFLWTKLFPSFLFPNPFSGDCITGDGTAARA